MACTITTSDDLDDDDDDAGRAGSSTQAGSGGAGRAGAGGSTGGSSAGRAGAAGASAGTGVGGTQGGSGGSDIPEDLSCDDPEGTVRAPSCEFPEPLPEDDAACLSCLSTNCCEELRDCYATEPSDLCGWGTAPDGQEEYKCYMDCLVDLARASDTKSYTADDQVTCSLGCGTRVDGMGESCSFPIIGTRTSVLMGCMHDNCEDICMVDRIDAP